jgi:threonine dehydrogenase-like Zn-dependent dehydrogenase
VNTVITEISAPRLESARRLSGALVVDAGREDPVQRVMELTKGKGADFVVEMGATQRALHQAFEMVRIRGTIGTFNEPVSFNPFFRMTRREIKLQSVMGRNWETWRRMNQLIDADQVLLQRLITHVLPLDEYAAGFELVKGHDVLKVLLKP